MFLIVEGIAGRWQYHLREDTKVPRTALCGTGVMITQVPITYWGKTPKDYHLPERWCWACAEKSGVPELLAALESADPSRVLNRPKADSKETR